MKQTNNAIKFLMAQYRAIFKHAYLKGIVSAVVLTTGLAASASNASTVPEYWISSDGASWKTTTDSINIASTTQVAGKYDAENATSGSLTIAGSTYPNAQVSVVKTYAYGGFATNNTGDVAATGNDLILGSGGKIKSDTTAKIFGGYAYATAGSALADGNTVTATEGFNFQSTGYDYVYGGRAEGLTSATATNNTISISDVNLKNGVMLFAGQAVATTVTSTAEVEGLYSRGNTLSLTNVTYGQANADEGLNMVVGNYAVDSSSAKSISEVIADGQNKETIKIIDSSLNVPHVLGGYAVNNKGGSASAINNIVSLTNTNIVGADGTNSSKPNAKSDIFGGSIVVSELTDAGESALEASNNKVTITNDTGDTIKLAGGAGYLEIIGAQIEAKAANSQQNLAKTTIKADNNQVVIGDDVDVVLNTKGRIAGTALVITSGGSGFTNATSEISATGNRVEINGNVTGSNSGHSSINAVGVAHTQTLALNNDVVINGKVTNVADITGGAGKDSEIQLNQGGELRYNSALTNNLISDVVTLAGNVEVGSGELKIQGFYGYNGTTTTSVGFNPNQTTIANTANIQNAGKITLYGQTTVEKDAVLNATAKGAAIVVDGGSNVVNDKLLGSDNVAGTADDNLLQEHGGFVGGKGSLNIYSTTLSNYLKSDNYTPFDTDKVTQDKQGTVVITSGGALEFADTDQVILSDFDFTENSTGASGITVGANVGKIVVDDDIQTGKGSIIKGKTLVIEHQLAQNGSTVGDELKNIKGINGNGVKIEADVLKLGSDTLTSDNSAKINFAEGKAKDQLDFTVQSGSFQLATDIVGARDYYTKDASGNYTTTLNEVGKITGDNLQIGNATASGSLTISGGAWSNTDGQDINVVSGSLTVTSVAGTGNVASNPSYYKNGNPASLAWNGNFALNGSAAEKAVVKVTGYAGADATLDLSNASIDWGKGAISISGNPQDIDPSELVNEVGQGILKVKGSQLSKFFDEDSESKLEISGGGLVSVVDSVSEPVSFNNFASGTISSATTSIGDSGNARTVYFNKGGVLAVDGEISLYTGSKDGETSDTAAGSALDIGNGTIAANTVTLNNLTSNEKSKQQVSVRNGTIEVSSGLNSRNDLIVFGDSSSTEGAKLVLNADNAKDAGSISSNLKIDGKSTATGLLTVRTGDWSLAADKDVELTSNASMTVGAGLENINSASLTADNLIAAGSVNVLVDGKATFNTAQITSKSVNVYGVMTLDGKSGITEESDPAYKDKDTAGINLAGAKINVNGSNAKFIFGTEATNSLVTITPATGSDSSKVEIKDALSKADISVNKNAELKLSFASGTLVDADTAKALKNGIIDNLNGGYLNVGKAQLDIEYDNKDELITSWANVEPFANVTADVTSDELKKTLVNKIATGTQVAGHYGAMQTDFASTSTKLLVNGTLGLHNARDGYFVFQQSGDTKTAIGVSLASDSTLLLEGAGKVGGITGANNNSDLTFSIADDSIQGPIEVLGDITGIDDFEISNETNVSGDVSANYIELAAKMTAQDVTVDELVSTADSALQADNLSIIGTGDGMSSLVTGQVNVKDTLKLGSGSTAASLYLAGGSVVSDKLVMTKGSLLNVGWEAQKTDSDTEDFFDETQNYTASFQTQVADLNEGGIVLDPDFTQQTAMASINRFDGADTTPEKFDGGVVDGSLFVGRNSALGIGTADLNELAQTISKYQSNGALDDFGAMLVLNKKITLDSGDGIVMTARSISDFTDYMTDNSKVGGLNQYHVLSNSIVFDDNTAMLISADAMNSLNGGALVTFKDNAQLVANGGEIIIAGNVRAKQYTLFDDKDNKVAVVNVDGTTSGAAIDVSTENGFLVGQLTDATGGVLNLELSPDARGIMSGASNPVFTTLVAYAQGYNGDDDTVESAKLYDGYKKETDTEGNITQVKNYNYNNDVLQYSISTGNGAAAEQVARLGVYGGSVQAALTAGATTYDAVSARMGVGAQTGSITFADNGQGAGLWVTPIYKNHDSDGFEAQGLSYGADMDMYGVALGGDYTLGNGLRVGAAFNVGSGDADGQGAGAGVSNDFDYYGFTVYGGYTMDKLSVVADVSYTVVDNDVEGNNGYGKVSTSMDTTNLSFGVTGQYTFNFDAVDVVPHAGLRYTYIDMDDYNVKDVDGDEVARYAGDSMSVFSIPVGVTFSKEIVSGEWTVKPSFDLTLTANVGDDSIDGSVNWGIDNLTTNLESEVIDSFTYGATLGVSAKTGNFSMGFGVNYTGASSADEYGVSANARFVF